MTASPQIKVWDPLARFFHWALVSAFTIAYISEEDFLTIHSWAGYLILSLLCIRFIWGFRGIRLDEKIQGHGFDLAITTDIVNDYSGSINFDHSADPGGFKADVILPLQYSDNGASP